jgi:hypothetical protein
MRKQFETRVRLVIYMDARDLNRLTARAKREGRVLVAWARETLMSAVRGAVQSHSAQGEPATPLASVNKKDSTPENVRLPSPELAATTAAFHSPGRPAPKAIHLASSNRLTCLCPTCSEYRRVHDLPLGGLKRAKK